MSVAKSHLEDLLSIAIFSVAQARFPCTVPVLKCGI